MKKEQKGRIAPILIFFLGLTLRLIPLFFGIESTDIGFYRAQAMALVHGENIYALSSGAFPYSPLSMFYPYFCLQISQSSSVPFHIVIKLAAILSDLGILLLLFFILSRFADHKKALTAALLYAVNPVSILLASFHGNIMPLVTLFMLGSYYYFILDKEKYLVASAFLLGLAIGWRSFPAILLPFFLKELRGTPARIKYTVFSFLPFVVTLIPFFFISPGLTLSRIFFYRGGGIHHGPYAAIYGLVVLFSPSSFVGQNGEKWKIFYDATKIIFFIAYLFSLKRSKRSDLLSNILLAFFLFYFFYASVASQYLIWALPFLLLLEHRKPFYYYAAIAGVALVFFYWVYFRDILFGSLVAVPMKQALLMTLYISAEALLSAFCLTVICRLWAGKELGELA